jgi:4-oxalocrotonate tautomerase
MPLAHIYFLEGRNQDQKEAMMQKVTEAICETLVAPPENVRVLLHEQSTDSISVGGETMTKIRAREQ